MNKPGYQTTEFWLTMTGVIMTFALIWVGKLNTEVGMPYLVAFISAYMTGRLGGKNPGSLDDAAPGTTTKTVVTKVEPPDEPRPAYTDIAKEDDGKHPV